MAICKNCGRDHGKSVHAGLTVVIEQHPTLEAIRIKIEGAVPYPPNVDLNDKSAMDKVNTEFSKGIFDLCERLFGLEQDGGRLIRNGEVIREGGKALSKEELRRKMEAKWDEFPPSLQALLRNIGLTPDDAGARNATSLFGGAKVIALDDFDLDDGGTVH